MTSWLMFNVNNKTCNNQHHVAHWEIILMNHLNMTCNVEKGNDCGSLHPGACTP